ncbi:recombinase family protein [Xenorhabdus ishibashii]|uniref:Putative DNA invertase n=1 Tax=Xenorhabdus ishibashii TaxID=1034471 RepID=A0A2D0K7S6_9GAMM|nr:recombinase family protein [Xenorhabdus ishibashii]PHM59499.1 putative DNA invertase [Xenorhabdus ishibashii]
MSRVFAYCRVSTLEQSTKNQRQEIKTAGFNIQAHRVMEESISGSVTAYQRPVFNRLLDRMEAGDILVVTRLDRLGRNAMDVRRTVEDLEKREIRIHCLALGGVDLTSSAGKMTMQVIAAVAEFERDLLIERTHAGIMRAKAAGKRFGRPPILNEAQKKIVIERLRTGHSVSATAREFNTTRQTILRVRAANAEPKGKK